MIRQTAMVTGASEGLGKSFAFELAGRGMNLVLVALPDTGLPDLSRFIRINFNVQVYVYETDLTVAKNCEAIFEGLSALGVSVDMLINNAGLGNWSWFADKPLSFYKTQIDLNITGTVLLTRLFLEQRQRPAKAYLLNVGSLGGQFVVPKKQVYGATKSFISYFTRSLQLELSGSGVQVTLLSPGGINTKPELLVLNHSLKGLSAASILEPETVAREAIRGLLKGRKEVVPGMLNRVMLLLDHLLPGGIKKLIIRQKLKVILKQHN
ncbi:short-chain dehydrogenase [Pedobacter yulinensis]|uniref:Short-chain dehydrogenase n=1 Tax=Pedobacter yulinensis TaxID=2126353 RepID=A0A2T3HJD7_9SPHI|nr:SDR family NAD(P)-dependent oxidoreductase [Pedobacter yulinensis]PST82539.1 short-chain dehydrogenase [Pedobacter yulinensis]